jgi:hypothetical protein
MEIFAHVLSVTYIWPQGLKNHGTFRDNNRFLVQDLYMGHENYEANSTATFTT